MPASEPRKRKEPSHHAAGPTPAAVSSTAPGQQTTAPQNSRDMYPPHPHSGYPPYYHQRFPYPPQTHHQTQDYQRRRPGNPGGYHLHPPHHPGNSRFPMPHTHPGMTRLNTHAAAPAYISPPVDTRRRPLSKVGGPKSSVPAVASSPASTTSSSSKMPPSTPKSFDSSLGQLTKRFVQMLKDAPHQTMELNVAVAELGIQKRRIYDITNVLEGVGLIVKVGNNNVAWCDNSIVDNASGFGDLLPTQRHEPTMPAAPSSQGKADGPSKQDSQSNATEQQKLDHYLNILRNHTAQFPMERHPSQLSEGGAGSKSQPIAMPSGISDPRMHMYVRYPDVTGLPMFRNDTVIGIRAPTGTSVEVPDLEQAQPGSRRYQAYLNSKAPAKKERHSVESSKGKPIDVYLMRPEVLPGSSSERHDSTPQEASSGGYTCEPLDSPPPPKPPVVGKAKQKKSPATKETPAEGNLSYRTDDYEPHPAFRHIPPQRMMPQYWPPPHMPVWGPPPPFASRPHPQSIQEVQPPLAKRSKTEAKASKATPNSSVGQDTGGVIPTTPDSRNDQFGELFPSPFRGHPTASSDWQGSWNTPGRRGSSSLEGSNGSFGASHPNSPNLLQSELYDIGMSPRDFVPASYVPSPGSSSAHTAFALSPARTQDADFSLPGIDEVHGEELSAWRTSRDESISNRKANDDAPSPSQEVTD